MDETGMDQFEQKISDKLDELIKVLKTGVYTMASTNFIAAKIQSAKTDYERNEAIKEAGKTLDSFKKSLTEG